MTDDLVLDLTNYRDNVGNYVNPGRYLVQIEDADLGASAQKKTPQLTLWLRVVGGDFDGSTLVENLYLTEGSTFRVVGFLQALNIPTPKQKLTFKLQRFINRKVYVVVEDDSYNGRTRARVAGFERYVVAGGSGPDLEEFEDVAAEAAAPAEDVAEEVAAAPAEVAAPAPAQTVVNPTPTALPTQTQVPTSAPVVAEEDEDEVAIDLDDLNL